MKTRLTHWQTTIPGAAAIAGAIALAYLRPDLVSDSTAFLLLAAGLAALLAKGRTK